MTSNENIQFLLRNSGPQSLQDKSFEFVSASSGTALESEEEHVKDCFKIRGPLLGKLVSYGGNNLVFKTIELRSL